MTARLMTMRSNHHIQWCTDGMVRASFFVEPKDYGLRGLDDKQQVREDHEILAQAVPVGHSLLLGLQVPLLDTDVRERMLDGIDLAEKSDFILEAAESYKRIQRYSTGTRVLTLTIPLGRWKNAAAGMTTMVRPGTKSTAQVADAQLNETAYWFAQAQQFVDRLAGSFTLQPVPGDCLPFIWNHNLYRGNPKMSSPLPLRPTTETVMASSSHERNFNVAALDEGGRSVLKMSDWRAWFDPFVRVVPIDTPKESTYQKILVPDRFPFQGAWFPGVSEFLTPLDGIHGLTVDWAMRFKRTPRDEALDLNTKALRKLNEQANEREGEGGFSDQEIGDQAGLLAEYHQTLSHREDSDEISFTTAIAVGAPNRAELRRHTATVRKAMKRVGVRLEAPRGAQSELWNLFNPGAGDERVYDDYAHITTSDMFAGLAPLTSAAILDAYGPIIGINLLSGLFDPLHIDFLRAAENDLSACIAISGELGSGKTVLLKTLSAIVADLAGQFFAFDRSAVGEWEIFANSITDAKILDFANPRYTIDPLRMLATQRGEDGGLQEAEAAQLTLDTLLPLLNIDPTEARGIALANMLNPSYRASYEGRDIRSLPTLLSHIRDRANREPGSKPELHALAESLTAVAEISPALFDEGLDPLPANPTATIFRTHSLTLPDKEQMRDPNQYRRLPMRARLGQAYYTFGGLIARQNFLAPNGRFGALVGDEAHHFTATDVGPDTINHFVRDGRKHKAGVFLASHDPKEDYPGATYDLIPMRFAFRHRDKKLARNSLEWLGADLEAQPGLIRDMTTNTSPVRGGQKTPEHRRGECFIRDAEGRIGRGKIFMPARPDRARAVSSSLEDTDAYHQVGAAS